MHFLEGREKEGEHVCDYCDLDELYSKLEEGQKRTN